MREDGWQKRIERAKRLANEYPFASEILNFYAKIAEFQQKLYETLERASRGAAKTTSLGAMAGPAELSALIAGFAPFLVLVEKCGPVTLSHAAHELHAAAQEKHTELLNDYWDGSPSSSESSTTRNFFAHAFLQPYAEFVRLRAEMNWDGYSGSTCPFCGRKPGVGVLRQQGDGGKRALICSFCLAEWEFRRIVCAGCGEENHKNLPVYTAAQFDHVRVECCDSCKRYLKTVDLTKTGLADPVVDELASVPLDLWAREHNYEKLEWNVLQL
jgi:formate dehydrogenase accessory protein FdhE